MDGVYHLFSKTLYRQIDRENLRNRRRHSIEFIRLRLLLLDFETEDDKVHFFLRRTYHPEESTSRKDLRGRVHA